MTATSTNYQTTNRYYSDNIKEKLRYREKTLLQGYKKGWYPVIGELNANYDEDIYCIKKIVTNAALPSTKSIPKLIEAFNSFALIRTFTISGHELLVGKGIILHPQTSKILVCVLNSMDYDHKTLYISKGFLLHPQYDNLHKKLLKPLFQEVETVIIKNSYKLFDKPDLPKFKTLRESKEFLNNFTKELYEKD